MPTRTFPKQTLLDVLWGDYGKIISNEVIDTSRWSIISELTFQDGDQFYQTSYSRGATESQDESPFEYADDEIECIEVIPVEKTVIVYEPKQ